MEDEIEIPVRKLKQSGWVLLGLVILFTILGGLVSPLDTEGKPVLLLPEVKAVEDYRRSARKWLREITVLEGEITQVFSQEGGGGPVYTLQISPDRAAARGADRPGGGPGGGAAAVHRAAPGNVGRKPGLP